MTKKSGSLKFFPKACAGENNKPLILKGAKQVGKTTAIHLFSERFDQYLYLNPEIKEEQTTFEQDYPIEDLLQVVLFSFIKIK